MCFLSEGKTGKKKNTKTWIDTPVDFMQLYGMKFCSDFYIKF